MFVKAEIWTVGRTSRGTAVLLRFPGSQRCVPVYVQSLDAQSILTGVGGVKSDPPNLPDLFADFIEASRSRVESVEISLDERGEDYVAKIHFAGDERKFSRIAKTADALALAVRCNAPIFLEHRITEIRSLSVSLTDAGMTIEDELKRLNEELLTCLATENYERAASIRDRLEEIEQASQKERP